jgi:Zn-dependent protease with chaperone function
MFIPPLPPEFSQGTMQQGQAVSYKSKISVGQYRHPKENVYFLIAAVFSSLIWFIALPLLAMILLFLLPVLVAVLIIKWMVQQSFKAKVFGNSIKVSDQQHKEIYDMVRELSARLGITKIPYVFIVNQGEVNAVAVRMIQSKYILLYSSLVDLMLAGGQLNQLRMILAHELAHHAAGHTSSLKNFFLLPSKLLPYVGSSYQRACELTADRIAFILVGKAGFAKKALIGLACGSEKLFSKLDSDAFIRQEAEIPGFFGFINELYSTHPRTTKRVIEIEKFSQQMTAAHSFY